jgi:hypothetical protein
MTETMPRAHTLPLQGVVNRLLRVLLRTPGLARLLGRRLITIYVVGRKSGRRYCVPVAYLAQGDALLVGTPFRWVRNLRSGEPVDVRLRGRRRTMDVEVHADEDAVVAGYATMARANPAFAGFNGIRLVDGEPDPDDLRQAWAAGARVIRLTPR